MHVTILVPQTQPESKLLLSTIRVALGEKNMSAHNLNNVVSLSFDQRVYTRLSSAEDGDKLGPLSATSTRDDNAEEFYKGLSIVTSSGL